MHDLRVLHTKKDTSAIMPHKEEIGHSRSDPKYCLKIMLHALHR